ncbi:1-deoxy-D-xylulose-5-phosphate reductoisomerase [Clostridiaceae bacterium 14S0207]|nr:1-deoxy-D-xylulose-5-phosphate reductoisomerase [Clostridiaceae bacterium 14S0207]
MKKISILGVTGSIGTQALEVIRKDKDNFRLIGISANTSVDKVINIIDEFQPKYVAMKDESSALKLEEYCKRQSVNIKVLKGMEGLIKIATLDEIEMVLTSVVGMIGLKPTIEAIRHKKHIALANKETLVVAGKFVIEEARKNEVSIIPVDSEHGAIFQCLQGNKHKDVKGILLTASGGPFKGKKRTELENMGPKDALKHPKWNMGKKISIDSASLMNKGLEVIEAHYLFNVPYDKITVVVHPESIIHSMVEYKDGTVMAQLATTDMKLPIQYALKYPDRGECAIDRLDLFKVAKLNFCKADMDTFKCLSLAYKAGEMGGNMPVILNSANEVVVELFLKEKIKFLQIGELIEDAMNYFEYKKNITLDEIFDIDLEVRKYIMNKFNN